MNEEYQSYRDQMKDNIEYKEYIAEQVKYFDELLSELDNNEQQ